MKPSEQEQRIGEVALELYRIDRLIGSGSFANVYHAVDTIERDVAVKVLETTEETALLRFAREINVLKAIPRNPSVVEYIDHGNLADGHPVLVTEYVDGITLKEGMLRRPKLPIREAVAFMVQLCHAFTGLHELGVAHRDVKPANILLSREGGIKLIDFGLIRDAQGILKLLEDEASQRVETRVFHRDIDSGMLAGTLEYMAPEQISDSVVNDLSEARTDTPSDVFSLGVILVELITGKRPFSRQPGNSMEDVGAIFDYIRWRLHQTEVGLKSLPGVDDALMSIITKALSHDPNVRQPDCRAFMTDLISYLETGKGVEIDYSHTIAFPMERFASQLPTMRLRTPVGADLTNDDLESLPELEMDPLRAIETMTTEVSPPRQWRRSTSISVEIVDEEVPTLVADESPQLIRDTDGRTPSRIFFEPKDRSEAEEAAEARPTKPDKKRAAHESTRRLEVEEESAQEAIGGSESPSGEASRSDGQEFVESLEDDETTKWTPEWKKRS